MLLNLVLLQCCLLVCQGPSSRLCNDRSSGLGAAERHRWSWGWLPQRCGCWLPRPNQGISPESRTLSQLVHFETHCVPSIARYIMAVRKVKPAIVCTFKAPSLLTFSFSCWFGVLLENERAWQHWQAVLGTVLLPSYLMLISYCFILLRCLNAEGVFMVTAILQETSVTESHQISSCNQQTLSLWGDYCCLQLRPPSIQNPQNNKVWFSSKGWCGDCCWVCHKDFCCRYEAEAKSPESCWFPWCVYCLYWKQVWLVNIHQKGSGDQWDSCWGLELYLGQSLFVENKVFQLICALKAPYFQILKKEQPEIIKSPF